MTALPFAFPHTYEWLDRRLDLGGRLQLRTALRELERSTDARLVALWSVENNVITKVVEFAGDDDVMPSPFPMLQTSVPSRDPTRDRQREEHDTVGHKIRMGGDAPTLGIAIVVPGVLDSSVLFDAIEDTAITVENVIIKSVKRTDAERRRAEKDEQQRRRQRMRDAGG